MNQRNIFKLLSLAGVVLGGIGTLLGVYCLPRFFPLQQCLQFSPIRGDQFLFHLAAFNFHGDIIIVRADQSAAAFKVSNFHEFRF